MEPGRMIGLVDWATARVRMILAFVLLSIGAGGLAYNKLPKEGEPDIEFVKRGRPWVRTINATVDDPFKSGDGRL